MRISSASSHALFSPRCSDRRASSRPTSPHLATPSLRPKANKTNRHQLHAANNLPLPLRNSPEQQQGPESSSKGPPKDSEPPSDPLARLLTLMDRYKVTRALKGFAIQGFAAFSSMGSDPGLMPTLNLYPKPKPYTLNLNPMGSDPGLLRLMRMSLVLVGICIVILYREAR